MKRLLTRLHLWLGLLIGIQVLLWMMSGVIMSWIHLDTVRGEDRQAVTEPIELTATDALIPAAEVLSSLDGETVTALTLRRFLGEPVWAAHLEDDKTLLINAQTGAKLSPISKEHAREIARRDYAGTARIKSVSWITESEPGGEYRGALPAWRADFDDWRNTRIYVSADSGQLTSRRNRWWRLFDFFWMLHIMDYGERTNFNSLLLRAFAGFGLLFACTGLGMVALRLMNGRYVTDVKHMFRSRKE